VNAAENTAPWLDEIRRVLADGGFPGTPVEWQHLCDEHGADPATVAQDAPAPELAGRIHDAAHLYPAAPWGEVVVRAWAEAWWEARQWQYRERPEITAQIKLLRAGHAGQRDPWVMEDPAEWSAFFREVLGRDMPRNAEHEARLHQLEAAELLTRDMWTNGPDGTSYLHGYDAAELAAERGGISFPKLHELRYLQLIGSPDRVSPPAARGNWQPAYEPWRHGGWYVTNIRYPGGAVGCVSRNYPDGKWRIVCDPRPDAHGKYTFRTRDDAARAERELATASWERVAELAAGLAPATGPGTTPNTTDAPCAACGTVVKAGKGFEIPGIVLPPAVLDSSCSSAIGREQDDPGGAHVAPDGYARHVGPAHHGFPDALTAESLPPGPGAGLRPGDGAAASSGQSAHSTARRLPDQSPRAARGRGRR
jgi:hypothetical protein